MLRIVRPVNTNLLALMVLGLIWAPGAALAHASEGGFVLLLPTGIYRGAGVAVVVVSALAVVLVPDRLLQRLFAPVIGRLPALPGGLATLTSLLSTAFLFATIWIGFNGAHDPLVNLLPLLIWTIWWTGLVFLQYMLGDLWHWINPWRGLHRLVMGTRPPPFQLPGWLGHWLGVASFLAFSAFLLADLAPADPDRLARATLIYWIVSFAGCVLFGAEAWLARAEGITILMTQFARVAPIQGRKGLGLWGWGLVQGAPVSLSMAVFALVLLGTGSFDGINETFWWLAQLGINPLEFPGRSAVVVPTLWGLAGVNLLLVAVFFATVWLGHKLAGAPVAFGPAAAHLALAMLPIAAAYHFAHYLTVFMVNIQYSVAALSDPLARGDDLLGLGTFYVTTGFFNSQDSVRVIFLAAAGAVVLGHVISILVAHAIALRHYPSTRQALLSQLPLIVLMVLYTGLGLWLLAAPKGA